MRPGGVFDAILLRNRAFRSPSPPRDLRSPEISGCPRNRGGRRRQGQVKYPVPRISPGPSAGQGPGHRACVRECSIVSHADPVASNAGPTSGLRRARSSRTRCWRLDLQAESACTCIRAARSISSCTILKGNGMPGTRQLMHRTILCAAGLALALCARASGGETAPGGSDVPATMNATVTASFTRASAACNGLLPDTYRSSEGTPGAN